MPDTFDKLSKQLATPYNQRGQMQSLRWYKDQVRTLFEGMTAAQMMKSGKERMASKIQPGSMYAFFYDPKFKETLPFYDTFPLVLPFKGMPDGFLGLNFHYLPYMMRVNLLQNLLKFRSNKRMDETTRIMTSWKLLQGAATADVIKPAVKHYLASHVQSRFLQIYPNEWATAIMLPVEQFQKKTSQQVWKISKSIIG